MSARRPSRPPQPQHNGGSAMSARERAGLRVPPAPPVELTPQQEAEMAIERQMSQRRQIHDNLARMLADDPDMFGQVIERMVAQGVVAAVQALAGQQVALKVKAADRICATCMLGRLQWNARHKDDLEKAQAAAMAQAGVSDPADPRVAQADITPFLPERLKPGGPEGPPPLFDSAITVEGTEHCPAHHPAAPQQQQQGRSPIILMPGIGVHAAAQIARLGQPGMPGAAVS